jgi:hypothetical protein
VALEDKELSPDLTADADITAAIQNHLTEGKLGCASAFAIARDLARDPLSVGQTADAVGTRLTRCQLGLFGYPNKQGWQTSGVVELAVPDGLEEAIAAACTPEGDLTCSAAWSLADSFRIPRMQLGWVAEELDIRIVACQLGAF